MLDDNDITYDERNVFEVGREWVNLFSLSGPNYQGLEVKGRSLVSHVARPWSLGKRPGFKHGLRDANGELRPFKRPQTQFKRWYSSEGQATLRPSVICCRGRADGVRIWRFHPLHVEAQHGQKVDSANDWSPAVGQWCQVLARRPVGGISIIR